MMIATRPQTSTYYKFEISTLVVKQLCTENNTSFFIQKL